MEKMLGASIFSFSHNAFKRQFPQGCQNFGLCCKRLYYTAYPVQLVDIHVDHHGGSLQKSQTYLGGLTSEVLSLIDLIAAITLFVFLFAR